MPPKKSASGQKRKRTAAEKAAAVAAQWAKKKEGEQKKKDEETEGDDEDETPAKKQKMTPKGGKTSGGRRSTPASSLPTRSSSRKKDPPPASTTPPRSSSIAKKKAAAAAAAHPFNSPVPIGRGAKPPPQQDNGERDSDEGDVIPPPIPMPDDLPAEKEDKTKDSGGVRPLLAKKEERPEPTQKAVAAAKADPAENQDDSDDYSDDSYDDHSNSSYDSEEDKRATLQTELENLQVQDGEDGAPIARKRSLFSRVLWALFKLTLAGSVVFFLLPSSLRDIIPPLWESGPPPTICYYDSPKIQVCGKTAPVCLDKERPAVWRECPADAHCCGGTLIDCPDGFSVTAQGCVLTASSNKTLEAVVELLKAWTAIDICKGHPERFDYGYGGRLLFHYSRVTGELELGYNLGLINHGNHSRFLLRSSEKGDLWIGLHPDMHVPLSYLCFTKRAVFVSFGLLWSVIQLGWYYFCSFCKAYFDAFVEEPLLVGVGSILSMLMVTLYVQHNKEKMARLLLENDIFECRDLALEFLSSDPSKFFTMAELAQKVMWKRYDNNKKGRARVEKIVMPKIVAEFRTDSRIKTVRRLNRGKPEDVWQWVAPPADEIQPRAVQFTGSRQ